jgi:hypothetical protein
LYVPAVLNVEGDAGLDRESLDVRLAVSLPQFLSCRRRTRTHEQRNKHSG